MLPGIHQSTEQKPTAVSLLWHRLPWNALFWWLTFTLFGTAAYFVAGVQSRRAKQVSGIDAVIKNGDSVNVVLVLNGDEILVEKGGGRARVRMLGIHSFDPVVNEREITAYGHASVSFLDRWILNKRVRLVFDQPIKDNRGRYLAFVELDGIDINRRMIEEGIAMVYTEYAVAREQLYLTEESMARNSRVGIWGGKKSHARVIGLRRNWAINRLDRTGKTPPDYLLDEK